MRSEVVRHLRCPVCRDGLRMDDVRGPLRCPRGHSFDLARSGYAHLAPGPLTHTGDTPGMVAARSSFLDSGHFEPVIAAIVRAAAPAPPSAFVLDLGAGPGHYLAAVLDLLDEAVGLAVDAAKPAVRVAARCHDRADAVVADLWQPLPLADACVDVALNVFAPRPGAELARVVRPEGILIVVTPDPDHLAELVDRFGLLHVDPDKPERVAAALEPAFRPVAAEPVRSRMRLHHADVAAVIAMGPSAYHTDAEPVAATITTLPDPMPVTLAVTVATYRRA